jgi:hypothetical protein
MASLAQVISSVVGVFVPTNHNLVQDLERDSQTLDRLRDSFSRILVDGSLSVWSFNEELLMRGARQVLLSIIVTSGSTDFFLRSGCCRWGFSNNR